VTLIQSLSFIVDSRFAFVIRSCAVGNDCVYQTGSVSMLFYTLRVTQFSRCKISCAC